jgi:hypothetical protein
MNIGRDASNHDMVDATVSQHPDERGYGDDHFFDRAASLSRSIERMNDISLSMRCCGVRRRSREEACDRRRACRPR